jgi:hypothetical protein
MRIVVAASRLFGVNKNVRFTTIVVAGSKASATDSPVHRTQAGRFPGTDVRRFRRATRGPDGRPRGDRGGVGAVVPELRSVRKLGTSNSRMTA